MVSLVVRVPISLMSNGVLRLRVLTPHHVLECWCPDVLKSNGVLRFRGLTSHGVLRCLCPDVPGVQWRPSFAWPDVSRCPSLFVS